MKEIPFKGTINGHDPILGKEIKDQINKYLKKRSKYLSDNWTRENQALWKLSFEFTECIEVEFKDCPKRSYILFTFKNRTRRLTFPKLREMCGYELANYLCFLIKTKPLELRQFFYDHALPNFAKLEYGGNVTRPKK